MAINPNKLVIDVEQLKKENIIYTTTNNGNNYTISDSTINLENGNHIFVKFNAQNSSDNSTLQINSNDALPIYSIGTTGVKAGEIYENAIFELLYNGTSFTILGNNSIATDDTFGKVKLNNTLESTDTNSALTAAQGAELKSQIGDLSQLSTTTKTDLVSAINQVTVGGGKVGAKDPVTPIEINQTVQQLVDNETNEDFIPITTTEAVYTAEGEKLSDYLSNNEAIISDGTVKKIVVCTYEEYKALENSNSIDPNTEYHIPGVFATSGTSGSGGSGGHTIVTSTGTAMPQRTNLQFKGATVTDSGVATVVSTLSSSQSSTAPLNTTNAHQIKDINGNDIVPVGLANAIYMNDGETVENKVTNLVSNINIPQELFYATGELSSYAAAQYINLMYPNASARGLYTETDLYYIGKPGSNELRYTVPVYSWNTAYVSSIYLKKYQKDEPTLGTEYDARRARQGEYGVVTVDTDIATSNIAFDVSIDCYSYNLTKIELGYYTNTGNVNSATYEDVTPSSITESENEYFNLSMTISGEGNYYVCARLTYSDDLGTVIISRNADGNLPTLEIQGGGGMACFTGETLVHTSKGLKQIKDITMDDFVLSENNEEDKEVAPIYRLFNHKVNKLYNIVLDTVDKEIIKASWSHPFYTVNRGEVLAKDLTISDILLNINNKEINIKNIGIEELKEPETVYEIGVGRNNNYYVGKNGILVHNEPIMLEKGGNK